MAAVTKFAYLKDLLGPKVRQSVKRLPFSTEGYEQAKNILSTKYGKTSEIVNAYVQNLLGLPVISGSNTLTIHQFYEKLSFNVQALDTHGKLREVNGYVRMCIDKLEGIRGDLVRNDDNWQAWNFPKFVYALQKWAERNPLPVGSNFLGKRSLRDSPVYITHQLEPRQRGCVNCDSTEHRPHECIKEADTSERSEKVSLKQGLCFNCTGEDHNVTEFKSRKTCLFCKRRHFHLRQGKVRPLDDSGPNWWQSSSLPGSSRGGVSSFALYQILVPEVLTHWPHCARKLEQSFAILECLRLKWCWASAIGWSLSDQILLG